MKTTLKKLTLACISLIFFGLILTAQSYAIDPQTGVGIWLFDEGEGDVAKDSSSNGNDGELVDDPEWIEGQFGTALSLNGAGQVVKIPEFGNVAPISEVTIMAWVKVEDVKNQDLFSFDPFVGDNRITIHFPWVDAGNAIIWQHGTDQDNVHIRFPGKTNNWEHWAFVGSAEESFMRILRNGSEVAKSGNKPSFQTSPQAWHIGGRVSSSFAGEIDEVAVFNVALTENDINRIMTKGLSRALGWTAVYPKEKLATIWGRVKVQ